MEKNVGIVLMSDATDLRDRADVVERLKPLNVIAKGALDGMTLSEIEEKFSPKGDEPFIVSTDAQGNYVKLSERHMQRVTYENIAALRSQGCESVLILCTDVFKRPEGDKGLLYIPQDMMHGILTGMGVHKVGFIVPEPEQIPESLKQYKVFDPVIKASSPYASMEQLRQVASEFQDTDVELVVGDCMGFTAEMGEIIAAASGKEVFIPRVVIPNIIRLLILQQ